LKQALFINLKTKLALNFQIARKRIKISLKIDRRKINFIFFLQGHNKYVFLYEIFEFMTEEQQKIIRNFEVRVHQMFVLCDKLKEENVKLKSQLGEQINVNDSLRKENKQLQLKYDNLKVARMISVNGNDFKMTKSRLSNLMREVDKCIALLNE